jgi:hypothetical protein
MSWHRVIIQRHGPWDGLTVSTHHIDAPSRPGAIASALAELRDADDYERIEARAEVCERPAHACPACGGRGWLHVNLDMPGEGIQACDDCGRMSDLEAVERHGEHCHCHASIGTPAGACGHCRRARGVDAQWNRNQMHELDGRAVCDTCQRALMKARG